MFNPFSIIVAALLTVGTLTTAVLPAQANNDSAIIQNASATTVVTGNGNQTVQTSDQFVHQRHQGRPSGDIGIVQTTDQYGDIYGNDNATRIDAVQTIEQRSRTHRRGRH